MLLSSYVLEVPHFILFPCRKKKKIKIRGVSLFRSQILLDRIQLEYFHVVYWEGGSSKAPWGPAAVTVTLGEGLAHWNSSWTASIPFQQIIAVWRKLEMVLLEDWSLMEVKREMPRGSFGWWVEIRETPRLCDPCPGGYSKFWFVGPGELIMNRWLQPESLQGSVSQGQCETKLTTILISTPRALLE